MVTAKCKKCGKEFSKETSTAANRALTMHVARVHTKTVMNRPAKKAKRKHVRKAKPRLTKKARRAKQDASGDRRVRLLCDVIMRLLLDLQEED